MIFFTLRPLKPIHASDWQSVLFSIQHSDESGKSLATVASGELKRAEELGGLLHEDFHADQIAGCENVDVDKVIAQLRNSKYHDELDELDELDEACGH